MRICGTILEETKENIIREAKYFMDCGLDMVEVRADLFFAKKGNLDEMEEIVKTMKELNEKIEILFTLRSVSEGGHFSGTDEEYKELVMEMAKIKEVDVIDIEARHKNVNELVEAVKAEGKKVLTSAHEGNIGFDSDKAKVLLSRLLESKGDIIKLAMLTEDASQADAFHHIIKEYNIERPHIIIAMGVAGRVSRYDKNWANSCMTFACGEKEAATGQIFVEDLKKLCYTESH